MTKSARYGRKREMGNEYSPLVIKISKWVFLLGLLAGVIYLLGNTEYMSISNLRHLINRRNSNEYSFKGLIIEISKWTFLLGLIAGVIYLFGVMRSLRINYSSRLQVNVR